MAIRAYHQSRGDHHRNVCIIPVSAHGTNPASAVMVSGFGRLRVVPVVPDGVFLGARMALSLGWPIASANHGMHRAGHEFSMPSLLPSPCCHLPNSTHYCASPPLQAGMTIVPVGVDAQGNINVAELKQKAEQHK